VIRRALIPTAVGFGLFWAILRLAGRWLLFSAHVGEGVYALALWTLMLGASLAVALIVARASGLGLSKAMVAASLAVAELVAIVLAGAVLLAWTAPGVSAYLLYSEPANIAVVLGLSAVLVGLTLGIIRSGRPRPPAEAP
jgi:hypothetical protein